MTDFIKRVQRWLNDRCEHCDHRFHWKHDARHSFGNRDGKVYHEPCIAHLIWRTKADERLRILAVICEAWGVTSGDVDGLVSMQSATDDERRDRSNMRFRVFYDLGKFVQVEESA